ncbi:hypothetical protein V6N00_13960 [Tersicoccus sp. MR15.9]|uniref:hypothetical protein n=1 Tax=Tersicoccus mangrovi TaxID=3121635 RepID=UPI002FE69696
MTERLTVVLPAASSDQISTDLRALTQALVGAGVENHYGGLGGTYGYGVEFENATFMMHPFCWCEQDDCPWCVRCTCPEDADLYRDLAGEQISFEEWLGLDYRTRPILEDGPGPRCAYCTQVVSRAANFLHRPTGTQVRWYKYIGRDQEVELHGDWAEIMADVRASLTR